MKTFRLGRWKTVLWVEVEMRNGEVVMKYVKDRETGWNLVVRRRRRNEC